MATKLSDCEDIETIGRGTFGNVQGIDIESNQDDLNDFEIEFVRVNNFKKSPDASYSPITAKDSINECASMVDSNTTYHYEIITETNGNVTTKSTTNQPAKKTSTHIDIIKLTCSAFRQRPKKYSCSYCDKMFEFKADLYRHDKIHKKHIPRKTVCSECGLKFQYKSDFYRHHQLHKDEIKNVVNNLKKSKHTTVYRIKIS